MKETQLVCIRCQRPPKLDWAFGECLYCSEVGVKSNYTTVIDLSDVKIEESLRVKGEPGIWGYRYLYSINKNVEPVSLEEGNTPLVHLKNLGETIGLNHLYVKDESRNPTWSHKDRLASVGVTKAKELGLDTVTVSSTGNHGAAVAAYAARAGMKCVAFTTTTVPPTMKTLMQSYGALLIAVPKPRDRWVLMEQGVRDYGWYPLSGFVYPPIGSNPFAIDGYKSIALEIVEQLGDIPDKVLVPTAYADALVGIWKGFLDLKHLQYTDKLPEMICIEPFGSFSKSVDLRSEVPLEVEGGSSVAFSIATPFGTYQGLSAIYESNGTACTIADDLSMKMQNQLACQEGLYAEASSAIALAALKELTEKGKINKDHKVVVLLTSTGLKDPNTTAEYLPPVPTVEPTMENVRKVLHDIYDFDMKKQTNKN